MNGMYEELIEKLRKNNRMSGWTHIDRLIDEAAEAIEALQQENEQLRVKLDEWKYEVKCHMDEVIAREKQIEQLRVRVATEKRHIAGT
jgi:cell division septum initiation protein DivIVA